MTTFLKTFGLLLLVGLAGLPFWAALQPPPEKPDGLILEPGDTEWEINDGRVPWTRPAWRTNE
jgi:hypothetical protein